MTQDSCLPFTNAADPRAPSLLWLLEQLAHFDREVIPGRRLHAKGRNAFGTFTLTYGILPCTRTKICAGVGKRAGMFMRLSSVATRQRHGGQYRALWRRCGRRLGGLTP